MNSFDLTDGTVANERLREYARLQQEIARLQQNDTSLRGGTCPLSGQRLGECADHQNHVRILAAQQVELKQLRQHVRAFNAA